MVLVPLSLEGMHDWALCAVGNGLVTLDGVFGCGLGLEPTHMLT